MGIYALDHGVHALVEKPIGVYTKQAWLIDVAATKPKPPVAFFNQRTNPLYRDLKALLGSGELGALRHVLDHHHVVAAAGLLRPVRVAGATWGGEGGGVLVNQAPHQLDLWQWICGVPKSVFAKCAYGFRRNIAVEDEVTAVVDFGDGATGTLTTCTHDFRDRPWRSSATAARSSSTGPNR